MSFFVLQRNNDKWMNNFSLCHDCGIALEKGHYCPLCEQVYSENDFEAKMMFCSKCKKWVHMECEGINSDEYECLSELPDDLPYVCKGCYKGKDDPRWFKEIREEMQAGFQKVNIVC